MTIQEYFRLEDKSIEKHDFFDGRMLRTGGGTADHSAIIVNAIAAIGTALKGSVFRLYESQLRIGIGNKPIVMYSDIKAVCGEPQLDLRDFSRGTILNPIVVVEVLSLDTEAYDRGRKFDFYRDIVSVQEYVLISQLEPRVDSFLRRAHGQWLFSPTIGLDGHLKLPSLNISIPLSEIYDSIVFPPVKSDEPGEPFE